MGKKKRAKLALAAEQQVDAEAFEQFRPDEAFAAWFFGPDFTDNERVTATSVLGLAAVLRCCLIISGTIAGLPLRTFEKGEGDTRAPIDSVFDDPWPGRDGMTPFAWLETVLLHLLVWRRAFLWHEDRGPGGFVSAYRPILPDVVTKVYRENGKLRFQYRDGGELKTVGTETITYIPGPSLDTVDGHPLLWGARAIFSGAISGDRAAARTLRQGIRLSGLVTPADGTDDFEPEEGADILENLRQSVVGRENAGDIALVNKKLKLQPWTPTNIEAQWFETRQYWLGEAGRIFGVPGHLLNDTEKQTSWGTGVSEQNLGFARYTLMGWTSRIEQTLSRQLPRGQYVEFDYKGLLQGTPAQEVAVVIQQLDAGLITLDYACKVLNLPAPTPAQKAALVVKTTPPPAPTPLPIRQEKTA